MSTSQQYRAVVHTVVQTVMPRFVGNIEAFHRRRYHGHPTSQRTGQSLDVYDPKTGLAVPLPAWLSRYPAQSVAGDDGQRLFAPAPGQGQPQGDEDHLHLVFRWALL